MTTNTVKTHSDLLLAFFSNTFDKVVGYVIILMTARQLSQEAIGEWFYVVALVAFVALFTNLGTGGYLTRSIAQEPQNATHHLSEILSIRIILLVALLSALNLLFLLSRPELSRTMLLVSVYVSFEELFYTFSSLFLGLRTIVYRIAISIISKIVLIALILWVLSHSATLENVLWSHIAAFALQLTLIYLATRYLAGQVRWQWNTQGTVDLVRRTWPFLALSILSMLLAKVDTFMLGSLYALAVVAIYEAAYKFLEVSRFIIRPTNQIYFPIYSDMSKKQQWAPLQRHASRLIILAALAGVAAIIFVMVFGELLITSVFGDKYVASVPVIKLLFWGAPALFVGFICQFLAIALHLERLAVRLLIVGVILNIAMNAFAIPKWGALGAAGTTVISETVLACLLILLCWIKLHQLNALSNASAAPLHSTTILINDK
jgi:PST family polysaccharide transporter